MNSKHTFFEQKKKVDKISEGLESFKILCVFCGEVWTAKMEAQLNGISEGCDSCGNGESAEFAVSIVCDKCGRTVYKKEFSESR